MKLLLPLIVLGIFCTDGVRPYISSSPSGGYAPWKQNSESPFAKPPSNVELDDIFREEYNEWANRYGKSKSDKRFENFKFNFMLQMQHNKKTGTFNLLNEFGDSKSKKSNILYTETPLIRINILQTAFQLSHFLLYRSD